MARVQPTPGSLRTFVKCWARLMKVLDIGSQHSYSFPEGIASEVGCGQNPRAGKKAAHPQYSLEVLERLWSWLRDAGHQQLYLACRLLYYGALRCQDLHYIPWDVERKYPGKVTWAFMGPFTQHKTRKPRVIMVPVDLFLEVCAWVNRPDGPAELAQSIAADPSLLRDQSKLRSSCGLDILGLNHTNSEGASQWVRRSLDRLRERWLQEPENKLRQEDCPVPRGLHTHSFRCSFARNAFERKEVTMHHLQSYLGHADIKLTAHYVNQPLFAAMEGLE